MGNSSSKQEKEEKKKLDPRDHRRAPKNIKAEYILRVTCLECAERHEPCSITRDMNPSLQDRRAYRDPANAGGAQEWTLAIDFCSWAAYADKSRRAQEAVKRACGGADLTYRDEGMGSTYGGRGVKPGLFGRGGDKVAASGPFHVDTLLRALREIGVKYTTSV
jgi:hypothetical protein